VRSYGSTQAVIDQYRKYLDVRGCLVDLDIGHLLPDLRVNTTATAKIILRRDNALGARESICHRSAPFGRSCMARCIGRNHEHRDRKQ
jgi:hypothetical protein